jgi:arylsulfatase
MNKKHLLFITTDEQHRATISALGAMTHATPNIDRLFARSTFYTNAYSASPVCLPSRCTWATGKYPHNSRSLSNIFGSSLSNREANLFTRLKEAGYTTSLHGKCHFIPVPYPATRADRTLQYGHFKTYYESLGIDVLNLQDDKNNSLWYYDDYAIELEKKDLLTRYRDEAHMKPENRGVFDFPLAAEHHPDSWVGQKGEEYILQSDPSTPHFCWVSFSGPHYPVDTPAEYRKQVDMNKDAGRVWRKDEWDDSSKYHYNGYHGPGTTEGSGSAPDGAQKNYDEAYWKRWREQYFANVCLIDEWIGRILDAADAVWGENYAVIFTSDHGEMMGNHSLWGKNGSLFEDVLRVPFSLSDAGQREGRIDTRRISSVDLFPTLLDLAETEIPSDIDGISLLDEGYEERPFIMSMCDNRIAILSGQYKLEYNYYQRSKVLYKEFYDLGSDYNEFENRYDDPAYRDVQALLEGELQRLEQEESLMSTIFYEIDQKSEKPYWFPG